MSFVHLHTHTHYSLLDGLAKPEGLITHAKEDGAPALAITDHGVLYGAIEFYQKAKKHGIKPIIGCEVYVAEGDHRIKEGGLTSRPYHLILLAKNNEGYQNLLTLVTKAHLEGFYYRPRVDHELLQKYASGLICATACLAGEVPRAILAGNTEKTTEAIERYQHIFGKENFYLELQHHPEIPDQDVVNTVLIDIANQKQIPLIATNDIHYTAPEDREAHDGLICIQTQKQISDEERMKYNGDFSMRKPNDMKAAFAHVPEAAENTLKIADQCNVELTFHQNLIPTFTVPASYTPEKYLEKLCDMGLKKRYSDKPAKEATERLSYELKTINDLGFASYFLICQDFIQYAKSKGIMVGPGRGSAAGSIVSYCLEITDIDPLKYDLLFERFLNPARISRPDIDIDFADNRRDEVLDYVIDKYGRDKVAQIITFGTMAARAAVRDAGRVLGIPYGEVDTIAKLIPGRPGTTIEDAFEQEPDFKMKYDAEANTKKVVDMAQKLEGVIRHASVHACAVVISDESLVNYTPCQKAPGGDDAIITQYSMKPIDDIGLLKMDFLGLRNLTILQRTINIVKRTKEDDIDITKIPLDDKKTFETLQRGETNGVFQLESAGMKRYLKDLKPTEFEDIIAMVSLYRPGPMEWIPDYIKGKHGKKKIVYLHPSLENILKKTYGIAVYQEQILEIAREFAGFSLGEADILRRAIGKKIAKELAAQRSKFIEGAIAKSHKQKLAEDIFDKVIEPFAGYGFNKSHGTSYAMIAYQTAYMKSHYPAEFMAALLASDEDNTDRLIIEIDECRSMGIQIAPPSINESMKHFTVVDDNTIRFGLLAIKGIGEGVIDAILEARDNKPFTSLADVAARVPQRLINKKTVESLAFSGALDEFGDRNEIALGCNEIADFAKNHQDSSSVGQANIFSMMSDEVSEEIQLPKQEPATETQKIAWEKEYLGMYVSRHPLQGLAKYLSKKVTLINKIEKKQIGRRIMIGGLLTKCKKIYTRNGANMLYGSIEDSTGQLEITVFPKVYSQYKNELLEGNVVVLTGKVEFRRNEFQFLVEAAKKVSLDKMIERAKQEGLYDANAKMPAPSRKGLSFTPEPKQDTAESAKETPVEPFVLYLPPQIPKELLHKIKELLMEHKGNRVVELHLKNGEKIQRIKVPFGVEVSDQLKKQVDGILSVK